MKNISSSGNESFDNKSKLLEEQFSLTREDFQNYITQEALELTLENFKADKKYKDIPEDSPFQEKVLVATFRSTLYPDVVATSSIGFSELKDMQKSALSHDLSESVYSSLASSGSENLNKKELAYMSALTKQDVITEKADFLKQENIKVEEVKIEQGYMPNNYRYYITLRDLSDNTPGATWGKTVDDALEKSLDELRNNQEKNKQWEKDMWEKWPEFMYLKKEYSEQLEKLGFWITSWGKNQKTNEYDMSLWSKESSSSNIYVKGFSWKELFEDAQKEAEQKAEFMKKEKKGLLDVTSFTIDEIVDLLKGKNENMYPDYLRILYQKLESALDTNKTLPVKEEDLDDLKARCIQEENYELATKITSYQKRKK